MTLLKDGERKTGEDLRVLLDAHVWAVAEANGITIEFKEGTRCRAYVKARHVKTMPIKTPRTYFIALHELGHLLARGRSVGGRFAEEGTAWAWALEESLIEPTPGVWNGIRRNLRHYRARYEYRERRGLPVKWPPEDHVVWRLLDEGAA